MVLLIFVFLADALKSNKSLKVLKLLGNRIQTEGAIVLAEALLENSSLEELGLSENQISDDAAPAIINMLKSNTSLKKLSLAGGNDITNGFKTKIQNASGETKVSF
jgi:Ran GTPase-activating protein (RanGAP) involved in mRNA processing and transport